MLKIRTEYLSVVGSDDVNDPDLVVFGGLVAAYRVLIVSFPEGWGDLAALDMAIRPDLPSKLLELDSLLRDKEDSFRVKAEGGSTA
jgi:hypothetical protein